MATVDLDPNFKGFLKSLNSSGVKYLLIGGYAVIYYGYHRVTDDLDVWIAVNEDNARRISTVLHNWGGFSRAEVAAEKFLEVGRVFVFGKKPVRIDLLTGPSGIEFDACYQRRRIVNLDRIKVPLISLADLKANKLASGRDKDLADLKYLPSIEQPVLKQKRRKKS